MYDANATLRTARAEYFAAPPLDALVVVNVAGENEVRNPARDVDSVRELLRHGSAAAVMIVEGEDVYVEAPNG